MATRGRESQPTDDHMSEGEECVIVFYEQGKKHRAASRGKCPPGYAQGRGGAYSWQSHHIVCISSVGMRTGKDDKTSATMEQSLYITPWNINEAENMIGLPMYRRYIAVYGPLDKIKPKKARDDAFDAASPQNLPAHDIDHNTKPGYTKSVTDYLKTNIWNKYDSEVKDHKKGPEWLRKRLSKASTKFEGDLLDYGQRKGGTANAWKNRVNDKDWAEPFSMAENPNKYNWGTGPDNLTDIFQDL